MAAPRPRVWSAVRAASRRAAPNPIASRVAASSPFRPARAVVAAAIAIVGVLVAAPSARAQGVPFDVTAQTIASTAPIAAFVDGAVDQFKSGDREKVEQARAQLLLPLAGGPGAKSQAFLTAYSKELNRRLMPIAKGKDPHAKLNAGLVIIRAAEQGRSPELSPVIAALIADPSPAIITYGMRAAGEVIVPALASASLAQKDVLVPAIAKAVAENPESPAVVFEAYQALTSIVLNRGAAESVGAGAVANATPRLVDAIHQLMNARLAQYAAGGIVEPAAELSGMNFLARSATYNACSPQQKLTSVREMVDVAVAAAAALDQNQSSAARNRTREDALRNAVKGAASALGVIARIENKNDLLKDTASVNGLGSATPASAYVSAAGQVQTTAMAAFPAMAKLAPSTATAPVAEQPTMGQPTMGQPTTER